jgi:glycine dehydrogenase subunit 2
VAAIMITNPNTCGVFEDRIVDIAEAMHAHGGYVYCDGANFNALVGRVRPGDLGIDCMHLNLHKTFSTPHGGGGPGSGPVCLSAELAPFAPRPWVVADKDGFRFAETEEDAEAEGRTPYGRMKGFHGQMGMFVRALAYMMSHGGDGLAQVSGDAVLAANYVRARLRDVMTPFHDGICMHECLFDDRFLHGTGVTTLDFAKAMIDAGVHPMTMYFPLIVHGAYLIEPTETESLASLDDLIETMRDLAARAKKGEKDFFQAAPRFAPRRRLDETRAARHPVLRWRPKEAKGEAAE